jgi:hypothetical protein
VRAVHNTGFQRIVRPAMCVPGHSTQHVSTAMPTPALRLPPQGRATVEMGLTFKSARDNGVKGGVLRIVSRPPL